MMIMYIMKNKNAKIRIYLYNAAMAMTFFLTIFKHLVLLDESG